MAIIIKDFKWKQTENNILIQVPLKGVHQSKVDVFTSEQYLKVSFAPYLFELFLLHPIDSDESQCTLTTLYATFTLKKCEKVEWECLEEELPRNEKLARKNIAIENSVRKGQEERKERAEKKAELKRVAVRASIALDTKHRNEIESIKEYEKQKALGDIEEFRRDTKPDYEAKIKELSVDEDGVILRKVEPEKPKPKLKCVKQRKKHMQNHTTPIPLPRKTTSVAVEFTPREFPTPSRESQIEEEEEWLRKQMDARRSCGFMSEDLRPEEKNPQWLKDKGDEFLKAKNYLGAISAYSFGIKLSENFVDFYVGRSAAHYAIGNLHKCINDCSTALELMTPPVQSNLQARVICIARRGNVLSKLGLHKEAVSELEAALKLQPNNEEIKEDLRAAKLCL